MSQGWSCQQSTRTCVPTYNSGFTNPLECASYCSRSVPMWNAVPAWNSAPFVPNFPGNAFVYPNGYAYSPYYYNTPYPYASNNTPYYNPFYNPAPHVRGAANNRQPTDFTVFQTRAGSSR